MSLNVALHHPTIAWVNDFVMDGEPRACLRLADAHGRSIEVYVEPAVAHAMADAFKAARAAAATEVTPDEPGEHGEDGPWDVWLSPADFALDAADNALMRRQDDEAGDDEDDADHEPEPPTFDEALTAKCDAEARNDEAMRVKGMWG
jgi:hypothetical protein